MSDSNNTKFKRVKSRLQLTTDQVVDIVALGGVDVSKTRAQGWGRGENTLRKPDAGSRNPDNRERRMKQMSDDEFEAFESGLLDWLERPND